MGERAQRGPAMVAGVIGLFMALVVAKNGNPVIFKAMESTPANVWEFLLAGWPASWGLSMLAGTLIFTVRFGRYKLSEPYWIFALLWLWLFWALLSGARSVAPELSRLTLLHFAAAVTVFHLGIFVLGRLADDRMFWRVMILGFSYVLWMGLEQHFGGLEATRKAFMERPDWESFPKEYQLRIMSNRVFGPFIYPNTFAGAILLWAPPLAVALWQWASGIKVSLSNGGAESSAFAPMLATGFFGYCAAACLFWTGSKAGWLIAMAMIGVGLLHLKMKVAVKVGIVSAVLILGLAGFFMKYRAYFEKGATSASARFIYWKAALQVANERPILGAGPGTFAKTFAPIKPPEAEMARLTHNDYLEQACDSGWPAFVLFGGFVGSVIVFGHRRIRKSPLHFAVWLGLFGWSLQSFVEFGLYIPAMAWSAFLLMGWLLSSGIGIDTKAPAR